MERVDYLNAGRARGYHRVPADIGMAGVLIRRGYRLEEIQGGERIIPTAIREAMGINADGTLGPLTPGSTQATTMMVHHPGIVKTKRFSFASAG